MTQVDILDFLQPISEYKVLQPSREKHYLRRYCVHLLDLLVLWFYLCCASFTAATCIEEYFLFAFADVCGGI